MKGEFVIGMVAAAAAGMAAAWFLKDQIQPPSATTRFMRNGKKLICRYKKMMA